MMSLKANVLAHIGYELDCAPADYLWAGKVSYTSRRGLA